MTGTDTRLVRVALTTAAVAAFALSAGAAAGADGGIDVVTDSGGNLPDSTVVGRWADGGPFLQPDEEVGGEDEAEPDGADDANLDDSIGAGPPDGLPIDGDGVPGLDGGSDEEDDAGSDREAGDPDPDGGPESEPPDDGNRPAGDPSDGAGERSADRDARSNRQATRGAPVDRPGATPEPTSRPAGEPTTRSTPTPSTGQTAVEPAARGPAAAVTDVRPNRTTVPAGQPVAVEAVVVNRADHAERVSLAFVLFGEVIDVREVRVPADGSRTVRFVRSIDAPGVYHPAVNGVETAVRVTGDAAAESRTPASGGAGPGFTGLVAIVAVVGGGILARRR